MDENQYKLPGGDQQLLRAENGPRRPTLVADFSMSAFVLVVAFALFVLFAAWALQFAD